MNDIARDLHTVIDDAEQLLRHAGRDAGREFDAARARLEDSLHAGKARLEAAEHAVADGARRAGRAADGYVHHNPWLAIGVAAGVGLLAGLLAARR